MKKILSLIIAISMIFGICCINVYAATRDPYNEISFTSYDATGEADDTITISGDYIGGLENGESIIFNDVDFGTHIPRKLYINAFGNSNPTMEIILKRENATDISLGSITVSGTGSWANTTNQLTEVNINGEGISGVYDLVFKFSGGINLRNFKFAWSYETISGPTIQLRKANNSNSPSLATASKFGAVASVDRSVGIGPEEAALALMEYDANGTMIKLRLDPHTLTDGTAVSFTVPVETKATGATSVAASLVNEDLKIINDGTSRGISAQTGTASTKSIDVLTANTTVTVSGSGVTDERVMIAVVPNTYDTTQPIYRSAVQLFEDTVESNTYYYQFNMKNTLSSGTYKVFVIGNNTNLNKTFEFTSPAEHYTILSSMLGKSDDEVMGVLASGNNATLFGTESVMYANNAYKTLINQEIQNVIGNGALIAGQDDYSPLINAITNAIVVPSVIGYLKNNTNVNGYLEKYSQKLGISTLSEYTTYYTSNKTAIDTAFVGIRNELTTSNVAEIFKTATAIGYLNNATSWGYVDESIKSFSSILGLDLSLYNRLKNDAKQEMCNNFLGTTFTSKDQIVSLFNTLISGYDEDDVEESIYEREKISLGGSIFSIDLPRIPEENKQTVKIKYFEDLDSVPWAVDSIKTMRSIGVINGKSETIFAPNDGITREEFVTMIARAFKLKLIDGSGTNFNDVNVSAWYATYVATAKDTGIVNGVTDEWFGIGELVTREQAAAMLYRAAGVTGGIIVPHKNSVAYTDAAQISDYAYDAISELSKAEVLNGMGNEKFAPKGNMTRAEAAVLFARFLANVQ